MSDILDKIAKVLAQAERTDNEHEAEAFLKQAQHLSTRYSIDLAIAREHIAKAEQREQPTTRRVPVGQRGKQGNRYMVRLFLAIAQNNDLVCDIAHNSTAVIPYGMPSDIDVTEALFAHLSIQMVESANAFLKTGEHRKETVQRWRRYRLYVSWGEHWDYRRDEAYTWSQEYVAVPIDGRTARANFYDAFIVRINQRLREARAEVREEIEAESTGTDLVLVRKADEVNGFYKQNSDAKGSWKGARQSVSAHSMAAAGAGLKAGTRARIGSQGAVGGGKKALA